MSFFDRLLGRVQVDAVSELSSRADNDPLISDVAELACGLARSCAALTPDQTEDALADIVEGRINASLFQRTEMVRAKALDAQIEAAKAREQEQVADQAADASDKEANGIEMAAELKTSKAREAKERMQAVRNRLQQLPLLARVGTPRSVIVIIVLGSSTAVGSLARLSLVAVDETALKWVITIAAGCVALAAEVFIGTFGADGYDRLPAERVRIVIPALLALVIGLIVTTEVLAAQVRQKGLEATQSFTVAASAKPADPGPLAPSMIWTGPLAILATITGSGAVGISRMKESNRGQFEDLSEAADRLKAAEAAVKDDEAKVKQLRNEAIRRREQAAQLRGTSTTATAQSDNFTAALEQMSRRHAELVRAIREQAKLAYRKEAERYQRLGESPPEDSSPRPPAPALLVPITLGASLFAFGVVGLLAAAILPGLIAGGATMCATGLWAVRAAT